MANSSIDQAIDSSETKIFLPEAHGNFILAAQNLEKLESFVLNQKGKPCVLAIEIATNRLDNKSYIKKNGELDCDKLIASHNMNNINKTMRVFPKKNIEKIIQILGRDRGITKIEYDQLQYQEFVQSIVEYCTLNTYRELKRLQDKYPNLTVVSLEHDLDKKTGMKHQDIIEKSLKPRETSEGFIFADQRDENIYQNIQKYGAKVVWFGALHLTDISADGKVRGITTKYLSDNDFNIKLGNYDYNRNSQFYIDQESPFYKNIKTDIEKFNTSEREISDTIFKVTDIIFQKYIKPVFIQSKKDFDSMYTTKLIKWQKSQPTQAINPDTNQPFINVGEAEKYLAKRKSGIPLHPFQCSPFEQILKHNTTKDGEFDNPNSKTAKENPKTPAIQKFFAQSEEKSKIVTQLVKESWQIAFEKIPDFEENIGLKSLKSDIKKSSLRDILDICTKLSGNINDNIGEISNMVENFITEEFIIGNSKIMQTFINNITTSDHQKDEIVKKLQALEGNIKNKLSADKSI